MTQPSDPRSVPQGLTAAQLEDVHRRIRLYSNAGATRAGGELVEAYRALQQTCEGLRVELAEAQLRRSETIAEAGIQGDTI